MFSRIIFALVQIPAIIFRLDEIIDDLARIEATVECIGEQLDQIEQDLDARLCEIEGEEKQEQWPFLLKSEPSC